jgi:hypothetical protein
VSGLAPYGTWVSPLSAADVAAGGRRLGGVSLDGDHIYWLEGRPDEGGRNALVRRGFDGEIADVTPSEINVRSRVHEYGGGAYLVTSGAVYCSNFADQRVYRIRDGVARPVTTPGPYRYADFEIDALFRSVWQISEVTSSQPARDRSSYLARTSTRHRD